MLFNCRFHVSVWMHATSNIRTTTQYNGVIYSLHVKLVSHEIYDVKYFLCYGDTVDCSSVGHECSLILAELLCFILKWIKCRYNDFSPVIPKFRFSLTVPFFRETSDSYTQKRLIPTKKSYDLLDKSMLLSSLLGSPKCIWGVMELYEKGLVWINRDKMTFQLDYSNLWL